MSKRKKKKRKRTRKKRTRRVIIKKTKRSLEARSPTGRPRKRTRGGGQTVRLTKDRPLRPPPPPLSLRVKKVTPTTTTTSQYCKAAALFGHDTPHPHPTCKSHNQLRLAHELPLLLCIEVPTRHIFFSRRLTHTKICVEENYGACSTNCGCESFWGGDDDTCQNCGHQKQLHVLVTKEGTPLHVPGISPAPHSHSRALSLLHSLPDREA